MNDLPTFIVIGAQKAGTTSLWAYLRQHPDFFLPDLKETDYFIEELNGALGLEWYRSLFAAAGTRPFVGEASTGYSMFPIYSDVPRRIAELLPHAKLVYVIREPIARMASAWLQGRDDGFELRSLPDALLRDTRYLAPSQYALQIEQYLPYFPMDQLLVIRAEDLRADPATTLARVLDFLGAPPMPDVDLSQLHNVSAAKSVLRYRVGRVAVALHRAGLRSASVRLRQSNSRLASRPLRPGEATVDDDLRARLSAFLRPDLERLVGLLGPSFVPWNASAPTDG